MWHSSDEIESLTCIDAVGHCLQSKWFAINVFIYIYICCIYWIILIYIIIYMISYGKIHMNSLDILLPSQFKINELPTGVTAPCKSARNWLRNSWSLGSWAGKHGETAIHKVIWVIWLFLRGNSWTIYIKPGGKIWLFVPAMSILLRFKSRLYRLRGGSKCHAEKVGCSNLKSRANTTPQGVYLHVTASPLTPYNISWIMVYKLTSHSFAKCWLMNPLKWCEIRMYS